MALQGRARVGRERVRGKAVVLGDGGQVVIGEQGADRRRARAEPEEQSLRNSRPMVEVGPEAPLAHLGVQIFVGRAQDGDVDGLTKMPPSRRTGTRPR